MGWLPSSCSHGNKIVPYCSEKWNAEGLHSDGNASIRTVPSQKMERPKKLMRKVEQCAIIPFRSRLNRQIENMSMERLRSRLNTKQNWYSIVLFLCEQSICPFQKLERRWIGTITFPPDWKVRFLRAEDIFPRQICALRNTTLAGPPHM